MSEEGRIAKAITRLIQETQDGQLKWVASRPSRDVSEGRDIIVDSVYTTKKDKREIRLYPYRYRSFMEEDVWYWEDGVALELADQDGISWWRFPNHLVIRDLLEAVQFKTVGVDQFIDKLLKEDDLPF